MTKKELKKIPLAEYCIKNLKYTIIKGKDSRSWRALESPYGFKILVKSRPLGDGTYFFKNLTNNKIGTLPWLLEFEGHDFLSENFSEHSFLEKKKENIKTLHEFVQKKLEKTYNNWNVNYLQERGINASKEDLKPILKGAKTNEYDAIFPLFFSKKLMKKSGNSLGLDVAGLEDIGKNLILGLQHYKSHKDTFYPSSKRIHGRKGISLLGDLDGDIYLFESPIDALSFHFLEKKNKNPGLYLSTCGSLGSVQEEHLEDIIDTFISLRERSIYSCFDNDYAGDIMTNFFVKKQSFFGRKVIVLKPTSKKDWNDVLNEKNKNLI